LTRAMTDTNRTSFSPIARLSAMFVGAAFSLALGPVLHAQAVAEAAGATSVSSSVASSVGRTRVPNVLPPAATQTSHILSSTLTSPVEANRKALEAKAGKDGGRLLLRSTPFSAQVWVNGQPVGSTPMLLIIAPGKYKIEMRGTRDQTAGQEVALLPKETQEVVLKLQPHYPSKYVVTK
jgi:hypothetical protein